MQSQYMLFVHCVKTCEAPPPIESGHESLCWTSSCVSCENCKSCSASKSLALCCASCMGIACHYTGTDGHYTGAGAGLSDQRHLNLRKLPRNGDAGKTSQEKLSLSCFQSHSTLDGYHAAVRTKGGSTCPDRCNLPQPSATPMAAL